MSPFGFEADGGFRNFFLRKKIQFRFKEATLVHGEYTKEMPKQLETKIK